MKIFIILITLLLISCDSSEEAFKALENEIESIDPTSLSFNDPFPLPPIIDLVSDEGVNPYTKFIAPMGGELSKFFNTFEVTVLNENKVVYMVDALSICSTASTCKKIEEQILKVLGDKYPSSKEVDKSGDYYVKNVNIYYRVRSAIESLSPYQTVHLQIFNRDIADKAITELELRLEKAWAE
jgi:hypothetical protein